MVSGDGIEVRNAVMVHRYQIGRKFIPQENKYVCGWVTPVGLPKPGLHVDHYHFDTYEVLAASKPSSPTWTFYQMQILVSPVVHNESEGGCISKERGREISLPYTHF